MGRESLAYSFMRRSRPARPSPVCLALKMADSVPLGISRSAIYALTKGLCVCSAGPTRKTRG